MKLHEIQGRVVVNIDGHIAVLQIDPTLSDPYFLGGSSASSSGLISTPLTGGSVGNFCVRVAPGIVMDAHPFMKTALRSEGLIFKEAVGVYRAVTPGFLPLPFTSTEVANQSFVALAPMKDGKNWRTYTGDIPPDLDPTLDPRVAYTHLGRAFSTTSLKTEPRMGLGDTSADVQAGSWYEDFSGLAAGASPIPTLAREQWNDTNRTMQWDPVTKRVVYILLNNTDPRRAVNLLAPGQFVDGMVRSVWNTNFGRATKRSRSMIGVSGTGAAPSPNGENGWVSQLNYETGGIGLYWYFGGNAGTNVEFAAFPGGLAIGTGIYANEILRTNNGKTVQCRAYEVGQPVPAWQKTDTSQKWTAAGWAGTAMVGTSNAATSGLYRYDVAINQELAYL